MQLEQNNQPHLPAETADDTQRYLRWLYPQGGKINVFLKEAAGRTAGDTFENLADASRYIEKATNCPDVAAVWSSIHAPHSIVTGKKWSAEHIRAYQFLAVDLDNKPNSGQRVCATDQEREHVHAVADKMKRDLMDLGMPTPLMLFSGNGYGLLFPLDLPYTPGNHELLSRLAATLAENYDDQGCAVDTGVIQNPAVLLGVVGTVNRNKPEVPQEQRFAKVRSFVGEIPSREAMDAKAFLALATAYCQKHQQLVDVWSQGDDATDSTAITETQQPKSTGNSTASVQQTQQVLITAARRYLERCAPAVEGQGGDNHTFNIAGHLLSFRHGSADGPRLSAEQVHRLMLDHFNPRCCPPWSDDELLDKVYSAERNGTPRPIKVVTKDADIDLWMEGRFRSGAAADFPPTDLGNAQLFAARYGQDVRFVAEWKRWIVWDGRRWAVDMTDELRRRAMRLVQHEMYDLARQITSDEQRQRYTKHVGQSQSRTRIDNLLSLASSLLAIETRQLDRDPWLFNCTNGTIDLRTGCLRQHRRENLITRLSPVVYDPTSTAPAWDAFIGRIFQDDSGHERHDLIAYVQKAAGYSLTGDVSEQCIFVLHGNGSNGKTTFVNLLKFIIGDYALTAQQSLLLQDDRNRSNGEDEANLFGIRLACCSETNEGQRFDESKVKRLTGSSRIRARRLYENSFEFDPTYKIWLDCNHLPHIRSTDLGIWRRVKRIPFLVAIPERERDTKLEGKLRAEASGILNWMLQGLVMWQQEGLKEPAEVSAAVNEYRTDNDAIGRFLSDCTISSPAERVEASKLYAAYRHWCEETGLDHPLSQISLGKKLKERNFEPVRHTGGQRYWTGLVLKDEMPEDDPFLPSSSTPDCRAF